MVKLLACRFGNLKLLMLIQIWIDITLKQTFLRYLVNCGMLALLGMPLFLIYADSKKLAVNDILSKTRLKKI